MSSFAAAVVLCSSFASLPSHTTSLFDSTTNSIHRKEVILKSSASINPPTSNTNSNSNSNDDKYNDVCHDKELFSVAPMMAHTNRHYHYYWRLFSTHAHLYTEMIPASQIVSAYDRELGRLGMSSSSSSINMDSNNIINSEEILEVLYKMQQQPREGHGIVSRTNDRGNIESLYELLCSAEQNHGSGIKQEEGGHVTLQIGGKDPYLLAKAAAIGAAFGSSNKPTYSSINLNCGCPSNAVSGRSGGASLMREPHHVAKCVESMNKGVTDIYQTQDNDKIKGTITPLSVKHRLGVRDASTYNVVEDKLKSDEEEAFPECSAFIKTIEQTGDVSKFQVHARLALLGSFESDEEEEGNNQLWVPTTTDMAETKAQSTPPAPPPPPQQQQQQPKVDHKRAQYKAKKKAREATVRNRSIPPLRPGVVNMLADEFPHLQFVANGGIQSMNAVRDRIGYRRISSSDNAIIGAMVGRSAINHPCSFANADTLWQDGNGSKHIVLPSRGDVLLKYIEYCDLEEERVRSMGVNINSLAALRRRLVAVPFHLFVGETGNTVYQRRIRKLASRIERYTAKGILTAALNEVPIESINKSVGEFTHTEDLGHYGSTKRSGPLQKSIH